MVACFQFMLWEVGLYNWRGAWRMMHLQMVAVPGVVMAVVKHIFGVGNGAPQHFKLIDRKQQTQPMLHLRLYYRLEIGLSLNKITSLPFNLILYLTKLNLHDHLQSKASLFHYDFLCVKQH